MTSRKKKPQVGCFQLTCHCLHNVRSELIFFSARYDTGLISPSLSLTWQLVFYTLCLNRCFGKKGQPVSSLFHISTGFVHNAGHAVGLRGFSTDRETVYRNCPLGRKTWRHGDPHAQNYAVCGDDLARINMIYHFYAPGYVEYSSIDKMAKYEWNMFRNCVAFLAGGVAPGTRRPHHDSELTSCYHDAFLTWGHYHNNIVLFYHDSPITRSHFMDPTDRAMKGFYCILFRSGALLIFKVICQISRSHG